MKARPLKKRKRAICLDDIKAGNKFLNRNQAVRIVRRIKGKWTFYDINNKSYCCNVYPTREKLLEYCQLQTFTFRPENS